MCKPNREEVSDTKEVQGKYFENLINTSHPDTTPLSIPVTNPIDISLNCEELNDPISLEEVEFAVKANANSKAPGLDQLEAKFIKHEACMSFLHSLFNFCFRHGGIPATWCKAIIKLIPKTMNCSTSPNDYCGIFLQSVLAKTYCRILNSRLSNWIELHSILSDAQNGFCWDRSCNDHIFSLVSVVEN